MLSGSKFHDHFSYKWLTFILANTVLTEEIEKYIYSKHSNYAIMVNGSWGRGKTHYIKNVLLKKVECKRVSAYHSDPKRKPLYISVNGLSNINDITKMIFINGMFLEKIILSFKFVVHKISNLIPVILIKELKNIYDFIRPIKWISGLIINVMAWLGSVLTRKLQIDSNTLRYSTLIDFSQYILIIDDFERSMIDINEMLGLVNNFCEHRNMKVIIICDESKLGYYLLHKNKELKYHLASMPNIDTRLDRKNDKDSSVDKKNDESKDKIFGVEDISERAISIFLNKSEYKIIKEKVIGLSYEYCISAENALETIAEEKNYCWLTRKQISLHKEKISEFMEEQRHYNLRTAKYAFSRLDQVFKYLDRYYFINRKKVSKVDFDHILSICLVYGVHLAINNKQLISNQPWEDGIEYGTVKTNDEMRTFKKIEGFRFVFHAVEYNRISEKMIDRGIQAYFDEKEQRKTLGKEPIGMLVNEWHFMSEDEFADYYQQSYKMIEKGKCNVSKMMSFFAFAINMEENIGIIDTEKLESTILNVVENLESEKLNYSSRNINVRSEYKDKFESVNKSVLKIIDRKTGLSKTSRFSSIFDSDDWLNQFRVIVTETGDGFVFDHKFLAYFNMDEIFKKLKMDSNKNVILFRNIVFSVYKMSNIDDFFKNDLESVEELHNLIHNYLNSDEKIDAIKQINLVSFLEELKEVVEQLSA